MKIQKVHIPVILSILSFFILSGGQVFAQRTTKGPTSSKKNSTLPVGPKMTGDQVIKLRKLTGLGRRGFVKNPEYRTSLGGTVGIDKDWCQITLEYMTAPEFIDDLTFQFYAVSEGVVEGKKVFSFYKSAVKYGDIERSNNHVCTMFLRPSAIKRFGELMAIAVEVLYQGKVVEEMSEEGTKMPEKWWKNPLVVENPSTVMRDGYLLNRSQSPFALISIEGYEFIK
ncbi:MAG: hypothetical protein PHI84_15750 [Kiritimatiellae bacterium]|nr:hypothetical protein [Kiritimatiellia bacterium]